MTAVPAAPAGPPTDGHVRRPAAITLTEVAQRAGVSRATTARALGGYGSVSETARALVLAAAAELRYRPNLVARHTRTGTTSSVGVVVADISSPFFGRATRSLGDAARTGGLDIVVVNTDEDVDAERHAVHLLLQQRVAGIVVAPASRTDGRHLAEAQAASVPVVLLDRRVRDLPADRVYADNGAGAASAMRHLVALGHRRIAYVSSAAGPAGLSGTDALEVDDLLTSGGDRIRAYLHALGELAGVDPLAHLRLCPFGEDAAYASTTALLARPQRPTAVFASDGVIALGVLRAVRDAGLAIPRDVSVLAGDEPTWSRITTPPLAAVLQPVADLGRRAMHLLQARIRDPDRPWEDVVLPTVFSARASIGPPPG